MLKIDYRRLLCGYLILWQHWYTFTTFTEITIEPICIIIGGDTVVVQGVQWFMVQATTNSMVFVVSLVWHPPHCIEGFITSEICRKPMIIAFIWSCVFF